MPEIPLRAWPSPRTYVQGGTWWASQSLTLIRQARNRRGGPQDQRVHWHLGDGTYGGNVTLPRAGHCSSAGIVDLGDQCQFWIKHEGKRRTGYFIFDAHIGASTAFTPVAWLPYGDPSISPDGKTVCIRTGNRYRGYRIASRQPLFDFIVPAWGKRFQGHQLLDDRVLIHRDVKTKGASRAHAYSFGGRLVESITTTSMGHEAEGFLVRDGRVEVAKRTGAPTKSRRLQLTKWGIMTIQPPKPVEDKTKVTLAQWTSRLGHLSDVSLAAIQRSRGSGLASRHVGEMQRWLVVWEIEQTQHLVPIKVPIKIDGRWSADGETQDALDAFRRSLGWTGKDTTGQVGLHSLTLLHDWAAAKPITPGPLPIREAGDQIVMWRGVRINASCLPSLAAIAQLTGPNIRVTPTQGGYNRGGVKASAGTHDGGAVMDLSVLGLSIEQISTVVRIARECGWAAWYRPAIKGLWPAHIHMVRLDDPTAAPAAKAQMAAYRLGRDGLAGNGRDTGPIVTGRDGKARPTWANSRHNLTLAA